MEIHTLIIHLQRHFQSPDRDCVTTTPTLAINFFITFGTVALSFYVFFKYISKIFYPRWLHSGKSFPTSKRFNGLTEYILSFYFIS